MVNPWANGILNPDLYIENKITARNNQNCITSKLSGKKNVRCSRLYCYQRNLWPLLCAPRASATADLDTKNIITAKTIVVRLNKPLLNAQTPNIFNTTYIGHTINVM